MLPTRDTPVPNRPRQRSRRSLKIAATALAGTMLLTGCAAQTNPLASVIAGGQHAMTAIQTATGNRTRSATPSSATRQAIQAVIQKANAEQQQALAQNNAALMQDTSTASYAAQLTQTQQELQGAGVTAIKLISLQWGPITVQGTSAQATTTETWQTTFADGSTQQDTEKNVYALVQEGGVWKIGADVQPATQTEQAPGGSTAPSGSTEPTTPLPGIAPTFPGGPGAATAPTLPASAADIGHSANWAGYAATGGTYTSVSGTWKVPTVASSNTPGADATWVGIGGVTSTDLIQAGTQATAEDGVVSYSAWVETLPQPSETVPLAVSPGDTISVSINQQGNGTWSISFKDETTGQTYQTTEQYDSSRSSAEWVEEAPAGGRSLLPLDQFGEVQFTAASTVKNGKKDTIAQAGGKEITMVGAGDQAVAAPSALGSNGASFSVSENTTAAQPTAPGFSRPGRTFPGGTDPFGSGGSSPFGAGGANPFGQGGFGSQGF